MMCRDRYSQQADRPEMQRAAENKRWKKRGREINEKKRVTI